MIGFVSLHCLSINPFIHKSILTVHKAQKSTAFSVLNTHRDFLYYCRTGYMVSTIICAVVIYKYIVSIVVCGKYSNMW